MKTEKDLHQLKQQLDELVMVHQSLTEDQIREFSEDLLSNINWSMLDYIKFSEDFIREFSQYVDWVRVSTDMRLSEDFIREFADKVDWILISYYQLLSDKFINEFEDKIDWMVYLSNTSTTSLYKIESIFKRIPDLYEQCLNDYRRSIGVYDYGQNNNAFAKK